MVGCDATGQSAPHKVRVRPALTDRRSLPRPLRPQQPAGLPGIAQSLREWVGFRSRLHHQYTKVNRSRLAFFFARSRVFAGTPADFCGLPSSGRLAHLGPISLSPGHSSLQPRSPAKGRSPQRPQRGPIQINGLRADESNGWIAASAGKGNHGRCVLSVVLDSYRRFATL